MNLYKKYPNFPKYRIKYGLYLMLFYIVCVIIMVVNPFPSYWSKAIGLLGSFLFIIGYLFCISWDIQESEEILKRDYD